MRNWLRRAEGSEVFFHNGLHGLYGFLSLGGSCHSDCSASGIVASCDENPYNPCNPL